MSKINELGRVMFKLKVNVSRESDYTLNYTKKLAFKVYLYVDYFILSSKFHMVLPVLGLGIKLNQKKGKSLLI